MAKKKHSKRRHYSAAPKKHHRRRRRMSAGGGTFKALSNPIFGGIVGGLAGILVKNMVTKAMASNANASLIGTAAPIAVGFFIRKKAPMVSAGMIAVPAIKYIGEKVPMLAEDTLSMEEGGNTSFVSENLLLADTTYLSDQSWSMNEGESVFNEMDEE